VTELSDAQLVTRCRAGDEDAWRELVSRFSRYVYAICSSFRLREQDAEDVFQEVFARAFQRLDTLRDDAALKPWLAQLTRRLCMDRLASERRAEPVAELDDPGEDEAIAQVEDAYAVHEAMAGLPEQCREILDRFFARDESYRTIGDALQLPAGTIASRISRCLTRLRHALEGRNEAA
jgi:RNA polymerase sigma factor (sigma-70 family)